MTTTNKPTPAANRSTFGDHFRPRSPSTLLRKLLSPFWGTGIEGHKCVWDEDKDNHLRYFKRNNYWRHLKTSRIDAHFDGSATLFGMNWVGNDRGVETVVWNGVRYWLFLAMIDIDCHGKGSDRGADAARKAINDFVPGVWWEPSTSGLGFHGYLGVLVRTGDDVTPPFENLEVAMKRLVKHSGADVTGVEVKGRPATVDHQRRGYQTLGTTLKGGDHFKLPRGVKVRYDEFLGSPALTHDDIQAVAKTVAAHTSAVPAAPPAPDYRDHAGSCGELVTPECIAQARTLMPRALRHVASLGLPIQRVCRRVIDNDVFAAVIVCRMIAPTKKDGSVSVRRIGRVWDALYDDGVLARRFNPAVFAAARNALTDKGCIDWQDEEFWFGHTYAGEEVRGRACRWDIDPDMKDRIASPRLPIPSGGECVDTPFNRHFGKRPVLNLDRGRQAVPRYRETQIRLIRTAQAVEWHERNGYEWRRAA
ncbi:hypothetical protein [Frigoriglobus tundricola]|uniref:Uncharacterized protein n=1 Tax=Frigoriglobus tundricola TaxID=2774151 RepID=A0A6M5YWD5_9BACT|nr:hypothetical protein [Frigoriglobus tundricola]QJW97242.1 hypothetical protein FTUN_4812 [Frigoriglobus tundricola]